jgi:hypothetical protein
MKWQQNWLPIESAPKDGTQILLYYPEYHRKVWVGHYYNRETYNHGKLQSKNEGWHNGADTLGLVKECQPTHWMPLPEAPNFLLCDLKSSYF